MSSHVLHTVAGISRAAGGPSYSVTSLCNHLGREGLQVDLLTVGNQEDRPKWILPDDEVVTLHCVSEQIIPIINIRFSTEFTDQILKIHTKNSINIIHDHGLWLPNNLSSAKAANMLNIPLVISTRGMLEPWALQYRAWKKRIMWWAKQRAALKGAAVLHATAQDEADHLRALGIRNPIAIIPNGVEIPAQFRKNPREGVKTALFISRIHPIKGLLTLVKAWAIIQPEGWRMVVAGPSEAGHEKEVKSAVLEAGLGRQFEFPGPVHGEDKWDLYRQADLFILPTFSENFGIVVAEALAFEIPVITTTGTPWRELQSHQCGWWVDAGVEPLVKALSDAIALSDSERKKMGIRGRKLVEDQYAWPKNAADMEKVYRWVLGKGAQPSCVRSD